MPLSSPSALAHLARCYNSCIPPGMEQAVSNYLLAQLVKLSNPELDVTPSALANAARCYENCIPPGLQIPVSIYLLYNILLTGGGGGGYGGVLQVFSGVGDPSGAQLGQNPLLPAIYNEYDSDGNAVMTWWWKEATGTWI
jgi:hypothetical protein